MDPLRFRFDRTWEFDVPAPRLWTLFNDTPSFPQWWPWLRSFDPVPLEPGARTRCLVGPPLPYVLYLTLDVVDVIPEQLVEVLVSGDVSGPALLEVDEAPRGSSARLWWELEMRRPVLRVAARMARPLLQWGHDWVVNSGVEQFRRAAISGGGRGPARR